MPFRNRSEAGRRLAVALAGYKEQELTILALPRGGVAVAAEVAAALDAPLDLILVRKVGVPFQPELAMGAVVDGGGSIIVRNEDVIEHVGIDEAAFKAVCSAEFAEIERRRERYLGNRERAEVAGRTAIVIDDGIATGDDPRGSARHSHAQSEAARACGGCGAERQPSRIAAGGRRHSVSRGPPDAWSHWLLLPRFSTGFG